MSNYSKAYLLLEDGTKFSGFMPYDCKPILGEAVFNTSHSGYQEILTDKSYYRQIVVFTSPHIGNVGVNREDYESHSVQASGLITRSLSSKARNWRSEEDLSHWLDREQIPILEGADTRAITIHLRNSGAMRAGIFQEPIPHAEALDLVKMSPEMLNSDLASKVTCSTPYSYSHSKLSERWHSKVVNGRGLHIAVLDFGVKQNILRELVCRGCEVSVLPSTTSASEILDGGYNGILISNGPGDPAAVTYAIETIRKLLKNGIPLFGICLGHQLISLAAGLKTFKLPFGHRGANHPVRREADGRVEITSQNHGFAVKNENIPIGWKVSHLNLNDHTVEGLEHSELPIFTIQYHPEASPGPHDGLDYFDKFIREIQNA
jgi:carbamoyl-phosphate synthase small subunit